MTYIRLMLAILVILTPWQAQASEINDAGVDRLKTLFSELMDKQRAQITTNGGTLETEGNILIEKAEGYYAVTLPEINIISADQTGIQIGLIAINVTPTDNPNDWNMSVALPTPILFTDKDGAKSMQMDIGTQRMGGYWNNTLNNFSKITARYNDVKITDTKNLSVITLGQIDMLSDLKEDNGKWSGPAKFKITNINMGDNKSPNGLLINEMLINVDTVGFNPEVQNKILTQMKENTDGNNKASILDLLRSYGDKVDMVVQIKGMKTNLPNKKTGKIRSMSLDQASFNFGLETQEDGKFTQTIRFGYDGLENAGISDSLTPSSMKFDLALNNLPLADIINLGSKSIESADNAGAQRVAALQMMMTLPQILAQAGTNLKMADTKFNNDLYSTMVDADFKANPEAVLGFTGTLNANITGMDKILNSLEAKKAMATPEELQEISKKIKQLQAMRLLSNQEGDVNSFEITLTKDAKILVNGKDASGLIGGGGLQ